MYNCYIHIPFCTSKCKYCRFASFSGISKLQIENYIRFLCSEIETFDTQKTKQLDTLYFWWGTPSTLNIDQFKKIFTTLKHTFIFSKDIEITIESTPEMIHQESLIWWNKLWINRISIWIQTLNQKSLDEISRSQKWNILKSLDILQDFFDSHGDNTAINLDFIIWLPFVSKWEIVENIDFLLKKYDCISSFSVYMLEAYYEIPEEKDSRFENIVYPNTWKQSWLWEQYFLEEYKSIKYFLQEKWFHRYEISNFAKKWYECKHNLWYWSHKETIAFWLGAFWFLEHTRFSNSENFLNYYAGKDRAVEHLTEKEIFLETVMFWLRTTGLQKDVWKKLNQKKVAYFIENKLLKKDNDILQMEDNWVLLLDYIIKEII